MVKTVDAGACHGLRQVHALSPLRRVECGSHLGAWYCVQSRPRMETIAAGELERQGFGTFLPLVALRVRRRGEPERIVTAPAFPGYLFARFDVRADRWRSIHSTFGVRRLFSSEPEAPIAVPDPVIEELLRLGFDRPIVADPVPRLIAAGSLVHIEAGPFVGHDGVCLWSDAHRVALLLEIMGAPREVRIPRQAAGIG